ncbi:hypothetical protein TacPo2_90 [Pantoea bacteriophage TacPo2]
MKKVFTTVTLLAGLFAGSVNAAICSGEIQYGAGHSTTVTVNTDDMVEGANPNEYVSETRFQPVYRTVLMVSDDGHNADMYVVNKSAGAYLGEALDMVCH